MKIKASSGAALLPLALAAGFVVRESRAAAWNVPVPSSPPRPALVHRPQPRRIFSPFRQLLHLSSNSDGEQSQDKSENAEDETPLSDSKADDIIRSDNPQQNTADMAAFVDQNMPSADSPTKSVEELLDELEKINRPSFQISSFPAFSDPYSSKASTAGGSGISASTSTSSSLNAETDSSDSGATSPGSSSTEPKGFGKDTTKSKKTKKSGSEKKQNDVQDTAANVSEDPSPLTLSDPNTVAPVPSTPPPETASSTVTTKTTFSTSTQGVDPKKQEWLDAKKKAIMGASAQKDRELEQAQIAQEQAQAAETARRTEAARVALEKKKASDDAKAKEEAARVAAEATAAKEAREESIRVATQEAEKAKIAQEQAKNDEDIAAGQKLEAAKREAATKKTADDARMKAEAEKIKQESAAKQKAVREEASRREAAAAKERMDLEEAAQRDIAAGEEARLAAENKVASQLDAEKKAAPSSKMNEIFPPQTPVASDVTTTTNAVPTETTPGAETPNFAVANEGKPKIEVQATEMPNVQMPKLEMLIVKKEDVDKALDVVARGADTFVKLTAFVSEGFFDFIENLDKIKVDAQDITYREAFTKMGMSIKGLVWIGIILGQGITDVLSIVAGDLRNGLEKQPMTSGTRVISRSAPEIDSYIDRMVADVTEPEIVDYRRTLPVNRKREPSPPKFSLFDLRSKASSLWDDMYSSATSVISDAASKVSSAGDGIFESVEKLQDQIKDTKPLGKSYSEATKSKDDPTPTSNGNTDDSNVPFFLRDFTNKKKGK